MPDDADELLIKARMFDRANLELRDFELIEQAGQFFARLLFREATSGRTGYVDTGIGPVNDESLSPAGEYIRLENILEDLAMISVSALRWDDQSDTPGGK